MKRASRMKRAVGMLGEGTDALEGGLDLKTASGNGGITQLFRRLRALYRFMRNKKDRAQPVIFLFVLPRITAVL